MLVKYLLFQARHVNRFMSYFLNMHQLSRCDIPCHAGVLGNFAGLAVVLQIYVRIPTGK